jgi:enterochelin esterase family protein
LVDTSEAALVERVLSAVEALQQSDGFSYEVHSKTLTSIKVTQGADTLNQASFLESMTDQGAWLMDGEKSNIALKRKISYPGSNLYPLNSEMRLVDGQVYARAAFDQPRAGLPAMPEGWIPVHGKSTLLYWPNTMDLGLGFSLQHMHQDPWSLLSGYSARELDDVLSNHLTAAQSTDKTLPDGSPAKTLTFTINSTALTQTIRYLEANNEANDRALATAQGSPIKMQFTLDAAGRLVQWELEIVFEVEDVDLTGTPGSPDGSLLKGRFEQYVSADLRRDPPPEAIAAPDRNEITGFRAYPGLEDFDVSLNEALVDGTLDDYWKELASSRSMPVVFDDLTVFLYRGEAQTVDWVADWSNNRPNEREQLDGSNVWMHTVRLPEDARLEYQIQLDGEELVLDPLNPQVETGGLGSKSVVQMPGYTAPEFMSPQAGIAAGTLTEDILISSQNLGYDVNYRVYTPAGYENLHDLPVLYVTDGQDFLAFGRMTAALDSLISSQRSQPVIAVFIDPRNVKTGENQRNEQFFDNPAYGKFIAGELVPEIDRSYRTNPSPDARLILGTSNGGYHSLYFGLKHSDTFHLVTAFSPSIWHDPRIIDTYRQQANLPLKFFISTGLFNDNDYHARQFKEMLKGKGYEFNYLESNEGHSYGNWRGKFDEMLEFFFPADPD